MILPSFNLGILHSNLWSFYERQSLPSLVPLHILQYLFLQAFLKATRWACSFFFFSYSFIRLVITRLVHATKFTKESFWEYFGGRKKGWRFDFERCKWLWGVNICDAFIPAESFVAYDCILNLGLVMMDMGELLLELSSAVCTVMLIVICHYLYSGLLL